MCLKDTQNHTKSTRHTRISVYRTPIFYKPYHIFLRTKASCHGISRSFRRNSNTARGRDVFVEQKRPIPPFGQMPLTSQDEYTYNVVRCFMHKKNFNKPRNPVFFLCHLTLSYKKQASTIFFLLTAMIIWFHGTVARTEAKHALFGLLRVSTGFLRVRKPEVLFFKPGIMTDFLRFTSAFLRVLNSTIKKT